MLEETAAAVGKMRMKETTEQEIEDQVTCLRNQGFPANLAQNLCLETPQAFPLRLWIVDNSSSMREADGRRLEASSTKQNVKLVSCTRWEELKDTVIYHAQLAGLLLAPTQFMLLNPPADNNGLCQMGVAEMGRDMVDEELLSLQSTLNSTQPGGGTPLTRHLNNVYALVSSMQSQLEREGQRVVVVLATDGVPTNESGYAGWKADEEFELALQRLQALPVWVVVRLCTNDDRVVQYYQQLDDRLEWNLEVLDDFVDEAKEVYQYNPWLNYALPLHRCREFGIQSRLFDLLDEKTLTIDEMREFLQLVFGSSSNYLPDPAADWEEFKVQVGKLIQNEEEPWNPIKKTTCPWIDLPQLEKTYGPHRHRNKYITTTTSIVVAICVLWRLLFHILPSAWSIVSAPMSPSPTPTSLLAEEVPTTTPSGNGSVWILGAIVVVLLYVPRGPPNTKLILPLLGVMWALQLPSLWQKSADWWKGVGWIVGGLVTIFLVDAFNDR